MKQRKKASFKERGILLLGVLALLGVWWVGAVTILLWLWNLAFG